MHLFVTQAVFVSQLWWNVWHSFIKAPKIMTVQLLQIKNDQVSNTNKQESVLVACFYFYNRLRNKSFFLIFFLRQRKAKNENTKTWDQCKAFILKCHSGSAGLLTVAGLMPCFKWARVPPAAGVSFKTDFSASRGCGCGRRSPSVLSPFLAHR